MKTDRSPLKVAILMSNMEDLGVQRVVINLYNHFDRELVKPTLILWKCEGKVISFLNRTELVLETDQGLPWPRFFFRLFHYIKYLRRLKPDLILSFVPATNISVTLIKPFISSNIAFIASEHAFLTRAFENEEYKGAFRIIYRFLLSLTYNRIADILIMTAEAGKKDAIENWGISEKKIRIIYNPQDIKELQTRSEELLDDPWFDDSLPIIIAAGRLTEQKGFDRFIEAISILINKRKILLKVAILGQGKLDIRLNEQVFQEGLKEFVRFLGFQKNHLKYIKKSTLFVMSSRWEAMPMVLAETMAIGTPIVSFDCPSGPYEMLEGEKCGFLVKDQDVLALADTIEFVINNPEEAKKRAIAALSRVKQFSVEKIVGEYQEVIQGVVNNRRNISIGK